VDRATKESGQEAGPYQEAIQYEVMAPLERWLLYFCAAAIVIMFVWKVETHPLVFRNLSPANSDTELPRSGSRDSGAQDEAFVLRKD
jgi:hypothetical protein